MLCAVLLGVLLTGCSVLGGASEGAQSQAPATSSSPTGSASPSALPLDSPDRPSPEMPDVRPPGITVAPPGLGLPRYTQQPLDWRVCGSLECADVSAPLDYANPDGPALTLALKMRRATATPRLGTLFVNPGGPGGSGQELVSYFRSAGLEAYDIVGWDPRGTGGSTPVRCFQGRDVEALTEIDMSPDDRAEEQALIVMSRSFGQSCLERSGTLLQHISTEETVRDLDLLRELVHDPKLNYLGYSYGTRIGATYAQLFGDRVEKMVLDSAINITDDHSIIQAQGFDLALHNFADWCVAQRCPLGEDTEAVLAAVTDLFDRADVQPIPTKLIDLATDEQRQRKVTQSEAVLGVVVALYGGERSFTPLLKAVNEARQGDGGTLQLLADSYNGRNADGQYDEQLFAFPAVSCLDRPDSGLAGAEQDWQTAKKKAPIFGEYFGPEVQCPVWPVPAVGGVKTITGPGAPPIVVIGSTGDSATPYQYAVSMAKQLESGVLVTFDGLGHATYGGNSACVDDLVVKYLTEGVVPPDQTVCKP